MEQTVDKTLTVKIDLTDEMIDRAILSSLRRDVYDEDGDPTGDYEQGLNVEEIVRRRFTQKVDRLIGATVELEAANIVKARVHKILDEGFPITTQWGEPQGTKTLRQVVGELVFKKDRYQDHILKFITDRARKTADSIVREEVNNLRGDIAAGMKATAAEALAKWMEKTITGGGL